MHPPSKARRRFHTDRVVHNRRKRALNETDWFDDDPTRLAYGRLDDRDPWDCGNPGCGLCHPRDVGRRGRERRDWRQDWEL